MGLTALVLLQHARAPARLDANGAIVLLEDQDRTLLESRADRRRPCAGGQGAAPSAAGAVSGAGGHRRRARARRARGGHGLGGDRSALCGARSGCSRRRWSRSIARWRYRKCTGRRRRSTMIEPLAPTARRLLSLFRRAGRAAVAARSRGRSSCGVRQGDRAGQHRGRSRAHPPAPRPAHQGERSRQRKEGLGFLSQGSMSIGVLSGTTRQISSMSRSVTATQPSVQSTSVCRRPTQPRPLRMP